MPGAATRLQGATLDNDGYISIGGAEWDPFLGHIDDLRLYTVALDAARVAASMLSDVSTSSPGLVGLWRFDEGGGQMAYDASPAGNHAALGAGQGGFAHAFTLHRPPPFHLFTFHLSSVR